MSTVATTQGVKELLSQKGVTLGQLVEATKPKPVQTKKKEGKPSRIKQATRTCLEVLDRIFGKVVLPGSVLTEEDMAFVAEEGYSLSVARSDFTARQTDLAKKVAEYITAKAEREGLNGPRDENGNIILARPGDPYRLIFGDREITQIYVKPKVSTSVEALEGLVETGELSEEDFEEITTVRISLTLDELEEMATRRSAKSLVKALAASGRRELDEGKALALINKKGEILDAISKATSLTPPSQQIRFH